MLDAVSLNMILTAIEKEKCILLLGPELNNLNGGINKEETVSEYLLSQGIKLHYYEKDGLFLYSELHTRLMLAYNLNQAYSREVVPSIYENIARIPFNLMISITPDLYLQKTFKKLNFNYNISVYNKSGTPKENNLSDYNSLGDLNEIETPNKETPLLYYLFGVYDKTDSLILTYDDLFNFILSILHKNELPVILKNLIQDAENLIFLGFRFDPWYVQILMRLLSEKVKEKYKIGISKTLNLETKAFLFDEFSMTFIDESIPTFIDQIYKECEKRNKLRIPHGDEVNSIKKLEECILKGDLDAAFVCLKKFLDKNIPGADKSVLDDQIVLNSGRYEKLKNDKIKGILNNESYNTEWCKIQNAVTDIISEIKKMPGLQ
jgi:hypothetical protein